MTTLYEKDFCAWAVQQSESIKSGDFKNLDLENLREEISELGSSVRLSLESYLSVFFQHWIKKQYAPEMQGNSRSWDASMENSLMRIKRILKKNPSLRREMDEMLEFAYQAGKRAAIGECLLLLIEMIPKGCPWTVDEILEIKEGE